MCVVRYVKKCKSVKYTPDPHTRGRNKQKYAVAADRLPQQREAAEKKTNKKGILPMKVSARIKRLSDVICGDKTRPTKVHCIYLYTGAAGAVHCAL